MLEGQELSSSSNDTDLITIVLEKDVSILEWNYNWKWNKYNIKGYNFQPLNDNLVYIDTNKQDPDTNDWSDTYA